MWGTFGVINDTVSGLTGYDPAGQLASYAEQQADEAGRRYCLEKVGPVLIVVSAGVIWYAAKRCK